MRLTGEILEREQLARVALAGALLVVRHSPYLPGLVEEPARNLPPLLLSVRAVQEQKTTRDRNWLWSQLPFNWNQPVSTEEEGME